MFTHEIIYAVYLCSLYYRTQNVSAVAKTEIKSQFAVPIVCFDHKNDKTFFSSIFGS